MKNLLIIFPLFVFSFQAYSQKVMQEITYDPSIRTVQLLKKDFPTAYPLFELNTEEKLVLSFDDLDGGFNNYKYTIVHCDAYWKKSDIFPADYLEGINEDYIQNYRNSQNTYQNYTHYWVEIPNNVIRPKISGNYLLIVMDQDNDDNVVFTRRFQVFENQVSIDGQVKQPTYAKFRDEGHEIDFSISYGSLRVSDPFSEIIPVIRQNGRWDNAIFGLKPQYIENTKLIYDYEDENVFMAGNEFRAFDTRSVIYNRVGVYKIIFDSFYQVLLFPDENRDNNNYIFRKDVNGKRIIALETAPTPGYSADYVVVRFYLLRPPGMNKEENVFVFGGLTDWSISGMFKMEYNEERDMYEGAALLKQGYYNYEYVIYDRLENKINPVPLEGSYFETENDYLIFAYYRDPFLNIHKLVGVSVLNSGVN